jgi:hypothetical protein
MLGGEGDRYEEPLVCSSTHRSNLTIEAHSMSTALGYNLVHIQKAYIRQVHVCIIPRQILGCEWLVGVEQSAFRLTWHIELGCVLHGRLL